MKKTFLLSIFALSLVFFSCTPLMHDLETEGGNEPGPSKDKAPVTLEVEIPFITQGELLTKDKITVTAKDENGNAVTVTGFEAPDWLPYKFMESYVFNLTVHLDGYDDMVVPAKVKVKFPAPDIDVLNPEFALGYGNYQTGPLKFVSWNDEYEYSYDDGETWFSEVKEFTPTGKSIQIRHKGDRYYDGEWVVYPSDVVYKPYVISIKTVSVAGDYKFGKELTASAIDENGKEVTKGVTYHWEYYDETQSKWIAISGATENTFTPGKEYLNKKIRAVVTKDGAEIYSEEKAVQKGVLPEKNIKVEIPDVVKGTTLTKEDIVITATDENGNTVVIKDFDVSVTLPCKLEESSDLSITIHTDDYEDVKVSTPVKVKYPVPENDILNPEFEPGYSNYKTGPLKFASWDDDYEYSYDDGKTWLDEPVEFVPEKETILVRHKGTDETAAGEWKVYPGDTGEITYKLPVKTVTVTGDYKVGSKLTAKPLDKYGEIVEDDVTFQWEYYDETKAEWIPITGKTDSEYIVEKEYVDKKIRATVKNKDTDISSGEKAVEKGILFEKNIKIEIPFIIQDDLFSKDDITVTATDEYGNNVPVTFDVPSWLPSEIDESFTLNSVTIHAEGYEDIQLKPEVKVIFPTPDINILNPEFETGYDDYTKGPLKFKSWNDDYEYSYDDGKTWIDTVTEFEPEGNKILVRHKGDNNYKDDKWSVYPSMPSYIPFKPVSYKVLKYEIEQNDIGLVYDEKTHVFTADEGFDQYIWLVKTGWYPEQDSDYIQIGSKNTFKLEDYLYNKPADYYKTHPEFGNPGKYYIQCVGFYTDYSTGALAPYSATAWMDLE